MAKAIPSVLDARAGAVDHPCSGMWEFRGLNAGGHEVFACDSGEHSLIGPHYGAGHECAAGCDHAFTPDQAKAAMAELGREMTDNAEAISAAMEAGA
jgi:hypothetical protein